MLKFPIYLSPINLFQRRQHQKLVDEIELKRRSNSQQDRLADYKMRQNLNRLKNSGKHLPINKLVSNFYFISSIFF